MDITFEDELAVDGADEEVDGAAELRDDEAAALVADEAELADAPVPTGAFCRRRRALSTSSADATDKMARMRSTIRVIVRLEYMAIDVCCTMSTEDGVDETKRRERGTDTVRR